MNCYCLKTARNVLLGAFTYLNCEEGKCNFEIPLCHCKNVPSRVNSNYYICNEKKCNFIIAICNCNKFCSIKISRKLSNPGTIFWSCRNFPTYLDCKTYIPIEKVLKKHMQEFNYHRFVCSLWKYMKEDKFIYTLTTFVVQSNTDISILKEYLSDDIFNEVKANIPHTNTTSTPTRSFNSNIPSRLEQSPIYNQASTALIPSSQNIASVQSEPSEDIFNEAVNPTNTSTPTRSLNFNNTYHSDQSPPLIPSSQHITTQQLDEYMSKVQLNVYNNVYEKVTNEMKQMGKRLFEDVDEKIDEKLGHMENKLVKINSVCKKVEGFIDHIGNKLVKIEGFDEKLDRINKKIDDMTLFNGEFEDNHTASNKRKREDDKGINVRRSKRIAESRK